MNQGTKQTTVSRADGELVAVNATVPAELYWAAKEAALKQRITLREIWIQAMEQFLNRR